MNLPNILSVIRICMVPLVPVIYFSDVRGAPYWTAGIYALASLTDILDGYIARRYRLITRLGRVLDPTADKMMNFCVLCCIAVKGLVPPWAVIVFFTKELLMSLGALSQYKKINDVPPSHPLGKFATVFFFLTCVAILLFPSIPPFWSVTAVSAALLINVLALGLYLGRYIRFIRRS